MAGRFGERESLIRCEESGTCLLCGHWFGDVSVYVHSDTGVYIAIFRHGDGRACATPHLYHMAPFSRRRRRDHTPPEYSRRGHQRGTVTRPSPQGRQPDRPTSTEGASGTNREVDVACRSLPHASETMRMELCAKNHLAVAWRDLAHGGIRRDRGEGGVDGEEEASDSDAEDRGQEREQPETTAILANLQPGCDRYFRCG